MNLGQLILEETCDTGKLSSLTQQIIAEMNLLIPNVLLNFEDLSNLDVSRGKHINLYLQSAAKESLRRAIQDNIGKKLRVNSAYRTVAQQHFIFEKFKRRQCFKKAAKPSLSNHEDGLALDVLNFDDWIEVLENHSWQWFGLGDEVHFTYVGGGVRNDIGNVGLKAFQQLWNKHNLSDRITVDGRFGDQTAERLNRSPIEGFANIRLLKLVEPNLQGEDVRKVQQALVNAGLLTQEQVNGIYDETTKTAVEKFQEQKGLSVDGVVGLQTLKALDIPT